ncbi:hypothetical protein ACYUJ6_02140 [Clostridium sp. JNZ X4-2]
MGGQYKLFKVFEYQKTLKILNELFDKEQILNINNKLIGIYYDYNKNQYMDVLRKVNNLNIGQKIITSRTFIKMLKICIEKCYFVKRMETIESLPKDIQQFIDDSIESINAGNEYGCKTALTNTDKANWLKYTELVDSFIDKLNWLRYADGIDVKSLAFRINNKKNIKVGVSVYNNGVISLDNDSILSEVVELIDKIME